MADRPADITLDEIDHLGRLRGEHPNLQIGIEKDGSDPGSGEQIGHVVVDLSELGDLFLDLEIDGHQLFVDRLKFLFRGFELFV